HLQSLIQTFAQGLELRRWQRLDSSTPIQPVIVGDNAQAMAAAQALHELGYWVPAIRPPTVPAATARLRVTLSAAHATADVEHLAQAINRIAKHQENHA